MKKFVLFLLLLSTFVFVGCTQQNQGGGNTETIYLTGKRALAVGKSTTLTANKSVTWSSSDEDIATVDANGKVVAVGFGDVVITATSTENPEATAKHSISVYPYEDPALKGTVANLDDLKATKTTVRFAISFGTSIQAVINEIVEEFEKEFPYIDVEVEVTSGYDNLKEALVLAIQSGTAPTIAVGYPDHFAEYLVAQGLVPLDPYIKSSNPEIGIWDTTTNDWISDYNFYDDYLEENKQFDVNETYYGLPFNKSTEVLIYNKEFFEEFNLTAPETWQDAEALSKQIYEIAQKGEAEELFSGTSFKGFVENKEFIPFSWDSTSNLFITAVRQWGGTYTEALYERDGRTSLSAGLEKYTDPIAVNALSYLQNLANQSLFNVPEAWELSYASDAFKVGKCIITIGSSAGLSYNTGGISGIGVAPVPYNAETGIKQVIQQGTNVCMFSQATDLERLAGWLLIRYMLSPEVHAKFASETGYFPVTEAAENHKIYADFMETPSNYQLAATVNKSYRENGFTYFTDPAWAGSSAVRENVGTAMSAILVARKNVIEALNEAIAK